MSILLLHSRRDLQEFKQLLQEKLPNTPLYLLPEVTHPEKITYAISWKHPHGLFADFKNLKVIASFGAGVDHILTDPELPKNIEVTKIVNEQLTQDMCDFVLLQCLNSIRQTPLYFRNQQAWNPLPYQTPAATRVGILGLGTLGQAVAKKLYEHGFKVSGWSISKKYMQGITTFAEHELNRMLPNCDILVCLLPLTEDTKGILNQSIFDQLPNASTLINVARGEHLNEDDLKQALSSGQIKAAFLDVFTQEPLPEEHWFWTHPSVFITPHIASITEPTAVVDQLAENYLRFINGEALMHKVNLTKAY